MISLLLALIPLTVLLVGWWREQLREAFILIAVALVALWFGAMFAFAADIGGASGSVDCWPNCSVYQDTLKAVAVLALPALLASGVVALVLAAIGRRRRAARRPG
jgi:hypothetical protein